MSISIYKIKKWYKMITGKSTSHVNQGVGRCYSKTEVAGYYNDLTEKVTKDDPGILVPKYPVDTGEELYFSIGIFQYGLAAYDLFLITHDEIYKEKFLACANWAMQNQQEDGGWVTFAYDNPEHPYSSMAQGEGISLLCRLYMLTKDNVYLTAIQKAITFMLLPIEEGGTTKYIDKDVYFYEFSYQPLVLNGWIFSIWGLWDYCKLSGDEKLKGMLIASLSTLKKMLPLYDLKYWSRYDLKKRIASPFYHRLHIAQLQVMYDITGESVFKQYAEKWSKYEKNPLKKTRAFVKKAIQKVLEKD